MRALEAEQSTTPSDPASSLAIKLRFCASCNDELPVARFPEPPEGGVCTHDVDICSNCWEKWLEVQVATKAVNRITCAQCDCVMDQARVRMLATARVYERSEVSLRLNIMSTSYNVSLYSYLDAEIRAVLEDDPNFQWCLAADCDSGQLHEDGEIFTCGKCGAKSCMSCKVAWHGPETCGDYQNRLQKEQKDSESSMQKEQAAVDTRERELREAELLQERKDGEEEAAAVTLKEVAQLCPGCSIKVVKEG